MWNRNEMDGHVVSYYIFFGPFYLDVTQHDGMWEWTLTGNSECLKCVPPSFLTKEAAMLHGTKQCAKYFSDIAKQFEAVTDFEVQGD